ncbi:MAG: LytTR family DNA-binding domain-containing protein [bacterium]|nr:LytTR family DNA-binding domain-containing protein [bacterium]MCM1424620.1 LytTR family DNA-binding domain-containing protein [bacterium]
MLNIAICDDDRQFTVTLSQLLHQTAAELDIRISCDTFYNGTSLVKAAVDDQICYDLIYLDVEMDDMDGIRAALTLRDAELPILIVYVSAHEEYLKELFQAQPFRFLSKPIEETSFRTVLRAAHEQISRRTGYYTFLYKKSQYRIPFDRITYFESRGRIVTIHTVGSWNRPEDPQQDQFYGKISDVEKETAAMNGRFLRVHQSFLVNFDYIKMMSFDKLELYDGQRIPISEDRRKAVGVKFMALSGGKSSPT